MSIKSHKEKIEEIKSERQNHDLNFNRFFLLSMIIVAGVFTLGLIILLLT